MKKIVFIRPENIYNSNQYPPLNLISIVTALKQKGFDVEMLEAGEFLLHGLPDEKNDHAFANTGIVLISQSGYEDHRT